MDAKTSLFMPARLIVASTRLPITLSHEEDGKWTAVPSTGGLVTALAAVREKRKFTWLGWPGTNVPEADRKEVSRTLSRHRTSPVFVPEEHMAGFYEGFSNDMLWPLFHNLTERSTFTSENWQDYRA